MFKIKISDVDASNGNIPVSWCVDAETLNYLASCGIKNPQVVLCIAPEGEAYHASKERRQVVPLKDLIAYIGVHASGKNRIWGFISSFSKDARAVKDKYLSRYYLYGESYSQSILNSDGTDWTNSMGFSMDENIKNLLASDSISVAVPAGCFAKEPAEWEQSWVNHFFRSKPIDQCDYRRRRILAYTIQPLWLIVNIAVRLFMTILGLLMACRAFSLQPLFHPINIPFDEAQKVINVFEEGSYFVGRGSSRFLSYARLGLIPLILAGIALFTKSAGLLKVVAILSGIFGGIGVFVGVGWICNMIYNYYADLEAQKEAWYLDSDEIETLSCEDKRSFNISSLPSKHRTIRLRLKEIKSMVCKPFSL